MTAQRELLLDSHLSRKLCRWLRENLDIAAIHASDLGSRQGDDEALFFAARARGSIMVSKDEDFVALVRKHGIPPHLLYVTCGNTHNSAMRLVFQHSLADALAAFERGDPIVEIGEP